jgi:hypothetical protein
MVERETGGLKSLSFVFYKIDETKVLRVGQGAVARVEEP